MYICMFSHNAYARLILAQASMTRCDHCNLLQHIHQYFRVTNWRAFRFSLQFSEGELPNGERDDGTIKLSQFVKETRGVAVGSCIVLGVRASEKVCMILFGHIFDLFLVSKYEIPRLPFWSRV
jgi:hypothetical protein